MKIFENIICITYNLRYQHHCVPALLEVIKPNGGVYFEMKNVRLGAKRLTYHFSREIYPSVRFNYFTGLAVYSNRSRLAPSTWHKVRLGQVRLEIYKTSNLQGIRPVEPLRLAPSTIAPSTWHKVRLVRLAQKYEALFCTKTGHFGFLKIFLKIRLFSYF